MTSAQGIDGLVMQLTRAVAQRRLYAGEHPRNRAACEALTAALGAYLAGAGRDSLFVGVDRGRLVHAGRYLIGPSIAGGQLIQLARRLNCGGFILDRQLDAAECERFLAVAAERGDASLPLAEARALLASRGVTRVELAGRYEDAVIEDDPSRDAWQGREDAVDLPSPVLVYQALFDAATGVHEEALQGHRCDLAAARAASENLVRCSQGGFTDIAELVAYTDPETYTVGHAVRVATLAVHVGERLGLAPDRLTALGAAALLHDVGKSRIPDAVLYKPSRLDRREIEIVRAHPELGAEILLEHKEAAPLEVAAAYGHHLRADGAGYPEVPHWFVRHPLTALLQVCDVFEALTAVRPYKTAVPQRSAFEIMAGDAGAFEPAVLRALVAALTEQEAVPATTV